MTRVALITDISSNYGGAEKVARHCITAAKMKGFEVAMLVGDCGSTIREKFSSVYCIALGQKPIKDGTTFDKAVSALWNTKAISGVKRLLEWAGEDAVIHIHGWSQILSPSIFYALRHHKGRIIVTAHDFFLECPNGAFLNYPSGKICDLKPMSAACIFSNCDKINYSHKVWRVLRQSLQDKVGPDFWSRVEVLLVHEEMQPYFTDFPSQNISVLRNFVTPPLSEPTMPWTQSDVLFLGRMTSEKGVDVLSKALRQSRRTATLIGSGPLLNEVRSTLVHCNVPGWVEDDDLQNAFRHARAFVFPSVIREVYGLVVGEALAAGLPIIVSDNVLVKEEIVSSGSGISFKSGDPESLMKCMDQLDDDSTVRRMSAAALAHSRNFALREAEWHHRMGAIYVSPPTDTR